MALLSLLDDGSSHAAERLELIRSLQYALLELLSKDTCRHIVCTHVCICTHIYLCVYIYVLVCMYADMYAHVAPKVVKQRRQYIGATYDILSIPKGSKQLHNGLV